MIQAWKRVTLSGKTYIEIMTLDLQFVYLMVPRDPEELSDTRTVILILTPTQTPDPTLTLALPLPLSLTLTLTLTLTSDLGSVPVCVLGRDSDPDPPCYHPPRC